MNDFYCPEGNTALLISGGVDSAVAVHMMCERGVKPHLFYIKIGMEGEDYSCTAEEDIELSQVIARKYGDQSFKAGEKPNLGEEMADVLWVLICLANQTGVDLTEEFKKSMAKKTKRDATRHLNNPKLKA